MALDEPKENDETFEIDGLTYVVEKSLLERVQPISVDYTGMGFSVVGNLSGGYGSSRYNACR
jgi:iron-sulfur cluster assembly protein